MQGSPAEAQTQAALPSTSDLIAAQEARREKRARRKNLRLVGSEAERSEDDDNAEAAADPILVDIPPSQKLINDEIKRTSREGRRVQEPRVRAQRAARVQAGTLGQPEADETAAENALTAPDDTFDLGALVAADDSAVAIVADATDAPQRTRSGARTAERARRRQSSAGPGEAAVPVALGRHLSVMTQQLTAAHRVIGRVTAERDILRQHLADALGIPVEEVVIATDGTSAAGEEDKKVQVAARVPSRWQKLNYFGGNDIVQMRRRRQIFVACLMAMVLALWMASRAGYWAMPDNLSRDSLSQMPLIGDLMTYFLAGWLFFRVAKVGSKGVRWVFPSDDRRRRRR